MARKLDEPHPSAGIFLAFNQSTNITFLKTNKYEGMETLACQTVIRDIRFQCICKKNTKHLAKLRFE
jgi:hypothetical protein